MFGRSICSKLHSRIDVVVSEPQSTKCSFHASLVRVSWLPVRKYDNLRCIDFVSLKIQTFPWWRNVLIDVDVKWFDSLFCVVDTSNCEWCIARCTLPIPPVQFETAEMMETEIKNIAKTLEQHIASDEYAHTSHEPTRKHQALQTNNQIGCICTIAHVEVVKHILIEYWPISFACWKRAPNIVCVRWLVAIVRFYDSWFDGCLSSMSIVNCNNNKKP